MGWLEYLGGMYLGSIEYIGLEYMDVRNSMGSNVAKGRCPDESGRNLSTQGNEFLYEHVFQFLLLVC